MISRKSEECLSGQKITFVGHPNTQLHPWVQTVERKFRQGGHTIQLSELGEQIVPEQDIISFLDWDGPFFHDMSEEDYNHFKDFISSSSNVLWATNSLQMHCKDPRYGLLLGVARTARAEELGGFHTLEIDNFNETAADALVTVFGKTQRQKHAKDGEWKDYEFALRGGSIYVGRLHWNPMAKYLLSPAPDTSPRTLDIGSYGILETIRCVQRRVDPLKAGEVEINMKYVGLNFRVRSQVNSKLFARANFSRTSWLHWVQLALRRTLAWKAAVSLPGLVQTSRVYGSVIGRWFLMLVSLGPPSQFLLPTVCRYQRVSRSKVEQACRVFTRRLYIR